MSASLHNPIKTILITALLTFLLPPAGGNMPAFAEEYVTEGTCAFVIQLQDESEKIKFINELRLAKEASLSRYGESFANTVQAKMKTGEIMELDRFSVDCLSCHDGISAKGRDIRYKNNIMDRGGDITSVTGSHPIGMDYGSYAYGSREFKPLGALKPGMELIDGKVGCLSCHNPFNPKKYHLAAGNERSKLCFTCHIK